MSGLREVNWGRRRQSMSGVSVLRNVSRDFDIKHHYLYLTAIVYILLKTTLLCRSVVNSMQY